MNKILPKAYLVISIFSLSLLLGCDNVVESFTQSERSGSIANEDIAAPLTEKAQQYENALNTSNRFIKLWQEQRFDDIARTLIDPDVKEKITAKKLADIYTNVEQTYGKFVSFKEGQWAFEPKKAKKNYFLFSLKSVTHENIKLNYLFQFLLDGEYSQLIGFYVREQPAFRAPGQIHSNKQ